MIGGSYIASEVAASLTELGSSCSMVMIEPVPLSRGFGMEAGRFLHDRLAEHGITVCGDDELDRFEGADGRVTRVITKRGHELEADAVVIGVGAAPDVMLARSAGLELGETGGVRVDSRLQTPVPGIFAAGDVAEYESVVHGGRWLRIEHWDVAFSQGRTVALNMLGHDKPHDVVPYFFSDLSDWVSLEYVGPAFDWDEEVIRGSIDDGEFIVWYLKDGRVAGALSIGRSEDLTHAARLLASQAAAGRIAPSSWAISRPTSARSRARCPEVRRPSAEVAGRRLIRGRQGVSGAVGRGRWSSARQPIDEAAEPIDRALQRGRHLECPLECRQHRDQLVAGLDDPVRAVHDLAAPAVDPMPDLAHAPAHLDQFVGPHVESFAEHHDRVGPLVEPLCDLEQAPPDRRDLLAELQQAVELRRRQSGQAGHGGQVREHPVDHRLWRLDGETENAQVMDSSSGERPRAAEIPPFVPGSAYR